MQIRREGHVFLKKGDEKKWWSSLSGIRTCDACFSGPNRYTNWAIEKVVITERPIHIIYVLYYIFEPLLPLASLLLRDFT